jgi:predicted lipid-binding transport protein (Tim44 family)
MVRMGFALLGAIALFFACKTITGFVAGPAVEYNQSASAGGINMVQPSGNVQYDAQASQNNYVNSEANKNNAEAGFTWAQATAVVMDSHSNFVLSAANATAVVANSPQGPVNTFLQGQNSVQQVNPLLYVVGAIVLFVLGYVAINMLKGGAS